MQVDRVLFPVTALGPGNRIGIWTIGCKKRCRLCANPELRAFDESKDIPVSELLKMCSSVNLKRVDGITISGGEPFCQPEELLEFLRAVSEKMEDVLVFSGYTYDELTSMENPAVSLCLQNIGVLIAGEYVNELNDNTTALIGSSNQKIYFFNPELQKRYEMYMEQGRQIQNFFYGSEMMSVGIHNRKER